MVTDPRPVAGREPAQEGQVRLPDESELLDQLPERDRVRARGGDVRVLVEGGQRRRLAPAEAERPVAEHALGVDEVPEDLPEAPLALGVPPGLPFGGYRPRDLAHLGELAVEDGDDVRLRHERHVAGIEGGVLRLARSLHGNLTRKDSAIWSVRRIARPCGEGRIDPVAASAPPGIRQETTSFPTPLRAEPIP
jgi:hypothetical protein